MVLVPSICLTRATRALRARLTVLTARLLDFLTASTTFGATLRVRRAFGLALATGAVTACSTFSGFTGAATASAVASILSSILVSSATFCSYAAVQHNALQQSFQAFLCIA